MGRNYQGDPAAEEGTLPKSGISGKSGGDEGIPGLEGAIKTPGGEDTFLKVRTLLFDMLCVLKEARNLALQ